MRAVGSAFGGRLHAGMEPVMVLVRPDRRVRSMLMYVLCGGVLGRAVEARRCD